HLFIACPFAKQCWAAINLFPDDSRGADHLFKNLTKQIGEDFYMEIILLMCWSIWFTRNSKIFEGVDPSVFTCLSFFKKELSLLKHRIKYSLVSRLVTWMD
ncbi:hypothetical protein BS78_08G073000, partial [Paspalum vaginatum]